MVCFCASVNLAFLNKVLRVAILSQLVFKSFEMHLLVLIILTPLTYSLRFVLDDVHLSRARKGRASMDENVSLGLLLLEVKH